MQTVIELGCMFIKIYGAQSVWLYLLYSERHRRMVRGTEKSPSVERPPGELEEGLGKETTPRKPRGAHGEKQGPVPLVCVTFA